MEYLDISERLRKWFGKREYKGISSFLPGQIFLPKKEKAKLS